MIQSVESFYAETITFEDGTRFRRDPLGNWEVYFEEAWLPIIEEHDVLEKEYKTFIREAIFNEKR